MLAPLLSPPVHHPIAPPPRRSISGSELVGGVEPDMLKSLSLRGSRVSKPIQIPAANAATYPPGSLEEKVQRVINLIRPAVQADGGDIEFVGIGPDKTVDIRLHGACVGCPASSITLQSGIERNLRAHVPEIKGIRALE